jgi:hypothetical protein
MTYSRRVLAGLERCAIEGAKAQFGKKNPPQPKAHLLLDNVDHPPLPQPPQSNLLTEPPHLRIATIKQIQPGGHAHE